MHLPELMNVLSAAMTAGSTSEQRRAAADVCRTLLLALEATPGQPLAVPFATSPTVATAPHEDTASQPEAPPEHEAQPEHDESEPSPGEASTPSPPVNAPAMPEPSATSEPPRRTAPFPAPTVRPPAPALPLTPQNVASFVETARNLPTETLLDLAISHVRNLVAAKGQEAPTPSAPVRFHLVPLPKLEGM